MKSAVIAAFAVLFFGQAPATKSVLGTVTSFAKEANMLDVKPDNAAAIPLKLLANTVVQKIAPGETNLKNAVSITASEVAVGDRVLVTLSANGSDALRIVVMSAGDIAKRNDEERQDWNRRGLAGIVSTKNANQIL